MVNKEDKGKERNNTEPHCLESKVSLIHIDSYASWSLAYKHKSYT